MAMVVMEQQLQQQETHKYYCRICNKGFGCGPALGGHMRAHGVIHDDPIDVPGHADADYDPSGCSDWPGDDRFDLPPNSKCMYALHANPNHFRSCRTCGNCGKEFVSWKSFLEHGKCNSDDDVDDQEDYELLASSPRSDDADDDGRIGQRSCRVWSKRKRSQRPKSAAVPVSIYPSSEEEDLANCLVMLSYASVKPVIIDEAEKSSPSASKDEDRVMTVAAEEKYKEPAQVPAVVPKGMFECKACKKVFSSHQALGGHRASHKKVKGCFAAKLDDVVDEAPPEEDAANQENINQQSAVAEITMEIAPFDNIPLAVAPLKKKSKVHECSICHRQFSSGQALGGHKRCHWITSNSPDPASIAKARQVQNTRSHRHQHHQQHDLTLRPMFNPSEPIDLNMPAAAPVDGLSALWQDIGSPLRLELFSAAISLEPWVEEHKNKATTSNNNNNMNSYNEGDCSMEVDDEIDSKIKLAKLSELKDVNAGGEASPWLQVGIGSSINEGSE